MNQPAWLTLVPASIRPEYSSELDELAKFAENAASEADTTLEEAVFAAGRMPAPEEFVRPFPAQLLRVDQVLSSDATSGVSCRSVLVIE